MEQYKLEVQTFKDKFELKDKHIEIQWLGCKGRMIMFSIHNISDKTFTFWNSNITVIDTDDNILKLRQHAKPDRGWVSPVSIDIYDDMLVRFVFVLPELVDNDKLKRLTYKQHFSEGVELVYEEALFDFKLKKCLSKDAPQCLDDSEKNNTSNIISNNNLVAKLKKEIIKDFPNIYNMRIGRLILKRLQENPSCIFGYDFDVLITSIRHALRKELYARPKPTIPKSAKKPSLDEIENKRDEEGHYAAKYGWWWLIR